MNRRLLLCAAGCAPLASIGCGTTPRAEPTPTRAFGADEFFRTDPRVLRAAVLSDARVTFQSIDFDVRAFSPENQQARYIIRLQRPMPTDARMLDAPAGQRWQVFMLDDKGVTIYETVRGLLATLPRGKGYTIDVDVDVTFGLMPAQLASKPPLRIDVMTDPRSGWFTLREPAVGPAADRRAPKPTPD